MIAMILKMSGITCVAIAITVILWWFSRKSELNGIKKLGIGLLYGLFAIFSTHYGILYDGMIINVRDLGPLMAGLFFSPTSGIIAGLIGGIERYIAGTYFGVGSYTRVACGLSTCLAGFVAAGLRLTLFKKNKMSGFYAAFIGSTMEVFHMYVVFITHRDDLKMAFTVVKTCAVPMIVFSGLGLAAAEILIKICAGEWKNPFRKTKKSEVSIFTTFQFWLFIVTATVVVASFLFSYRIQTQSAIQSRSEDLKEAAQQIRTAYLNEVPIIMADRSVTYSIVTEDLNVIVGDSAGESITQAQYDEFRSHRGNIYTGDYWGKRSLITVGVDQFGTLLITAMSNEEVYWNRDAQAYEIALADILLFTVIYIIVAYLVNHIVIDNIRMINLSLEKITKGDLNEEVTVRNSSEFSELSDDINETVGALKGYITAAEKRMESELMMAKSIQESALPRHFEFPERDDFELYAIMNPAKEVGGDFYDFFFVGEDLLALVIADVSGKSIPGAMFMMRSKTTIRNIAETCTDPSEVLYKTNNILYEGNEASMFVSVWIGILDLKTGKMRCANAGHEFPTIMRANGDYELIKDKHSLVLAVMSDVKPKEYEIELKKGDRLFVYTDGVPEATNVDDVQYTTERMLEALNKTKELSISETPDFIADDISAFTGEAEQFDDITMLAIEYKK